MVAGYTHRETTALLPLLVSNTKRETTPKRHKQEAINNQENRFGRKSKP